MNKASERFTGWSLQAALGRKCYEVFGDKSLTCKELCPVEKSIFRKIPILHHEGKMVTLFGEERNMQISASPIYEGKSVTGAVVATQDMTHLKELEQTRIKTLMALEKEMEECKKAEEGVLRARKFESIGKYKEAKESKKSFDAVIMDLTIPGGIGGREAVKRLLDIDPEARLIVSSGYLNDPAILNFSKYGFQGSVPKPFKIQELSETLRNVIKE